MGNENTCCKYLKDLIPNESQNELGDRKIMKINRKNIFKTHLKYAYTKNDEARHLSDLTSSIHNLDKKKTKSDCLNDSFSKYNFPMLSPIKKSADEEEIVNFYTPKIVNFLQSEKLDNNAYRKIRNKYNFFE